jgi:hypothetical protein
MSLSAQESCLCPAEIHLYIGAITRGAGHVGLCGTYAAVVAVDTVTNSGDQYEVEFDTSGKWSCDFCSTLSVTLVALYSCCQLSFYVVALLR